MAMHIAVRGVPNNWQPIHEMTDAETMNSPTNYSWHEEWRKKTTSKSSLAEVYKFLCHQELPKVLKFGKFYTFH
jgi:hypothetical protein